MTKKTEQIIDVEVMEAGSAETQELAELNIYKNDIIAKSGKKRLGTLDAVCQAGGLA